jgi:hypothetical protein
MVSGEGRRAKGERRFTTGFFDGWGHDGFMRRMPGCVAVAITMSLGLGEAGRAGTIDFNRDVRPIFNHHCTSCHGGVKQAGGLSFIYREKALGKGKSGEVAIVPGQPEQSALFRRVTSKDPDERMPPPGRGERMGLSTAEVEVMRQWITGGARWGEHWSYRKPELPPVPRVRQTGWSRCDLDRFVLARLEAEGLKPSPQADRAQWLRRAALDLTGIPPTLDELSTFLRDRSPRAFENAADRYLSSPAFGERWAALWMDLARYADTQGYEKDNHRDIWPYRDWLIRAFNADMPFDEFTVRQLAGDLLPDATMDDRIATGFHRNTQTNTEGGTDDEEFRLLAVIDRVNTTWTVWQATTFGCIQCHSHPYEPFPHEDYYRFLSFFNNTEDADLGDDFPRLQVPKDMEKFTEAESLDVQIDTLRAQLNDAGLPLAQAEAWSPAQLGAITGAREARFTVNDNEVVVDGTVGNGTKYVIPMTASGLTALRLDILPRKNDPKTLPENGAVVGQLWLELELPPEDVAVTPTTVEGSSGGSGGSSTNATPAGKPRVKRIDFAAVFADELTGPFDPEESLKPGGPGGGAFPKLFGPRWLVFVTKEPVVVPEGAQARVHLKHDISDNETKGSILYHFKLSTTTNAAWTQLVSSPARAELSRRWEEARKKRHQIAAVNTLVMQERPAPAHRETRLFVRGNFLSKDKVVESGVPGLFPPLPAGQSNRLAVARWLVSPENPLTARVLVNRFWAELFGIGLVETVEDFGSTGMPPSHPELLDYLALHFQNDMKWSVKALLRELVLSSVYRQDHRATPKALAKDPRNRLLAHGPRTRLTAEMVRDQALQAAGVLSRKLGGPSVMPPQPEGVWQIVYNGSKWETPKGEDRYRRGLYTYWRRTSPYPSFMTFDASSREVCTARRLVTNTPLQALVTLNDPVYFEAAQGLAARMLQEAPELSRRVTVGWRLVTTADPKATDVERLERLYQGALAAYRKEPELSAKAGATAELAALTLVASTLLNLDEALTK